MFSPEVLLQNTPLLLTLFAAAAMYYNIIRSFRVPSLPHACVAHVTCVGGGVLHLPSFPPPSLMPPCIIIIIVIERRRE